MDLDSTGIVLIYFSFPYQINYLFLQFLSYLTGGEYLWQNQ